MMLVMGFLTTSKEVQYSANSFSLTYSLSHELFATTIFISMAAKGNTRASILTFGLDKSRIIWDPGGSILLHRLGGKPNLKGRGMSGHGYGLMGWTACASQPRPKEDTMKHYKSNRSRRGNHIKYSEYTKQVIFLLLIFPFALLFFF
jgi:hypothetical protein